MHANTAFELARSWDWATREAERGVPSPLTPLRRRGNPSLRDAIRTAALRLFGADTDHPPHYEPSGANFLSGALAEAGAMARVLPVGQFPAWLGRFLPGLASSEPAALFQPAVVTDTSDGQLAHLEGLSLSRAAAFVAVADALPVSDDQVAPMLAAAERHAAASLAQAAGGDNMVEHWLAAFAILLLGQ